jgi:hypothetical protein
MNIFVPKSDRICTPLVPTALFHLGTDANQYVKALVGVLTLIVIG